jgi:uridine kinase
VVLSIDQVADALSDRIRVADLIAIDGLPCSGKTTLAERLASQFELDTLGFDDFYLPEPFWPADIAPGFPFPFFRIGEFREAVRALKTEGRCSYRCHNWDTGQISASARELRRNGPLIVEGCSVLDPEISALYDVSVFVISDPATLMDARRARDGDVDALHWEHLFLPSVELYMKTMPQQRADVLVLGRGSPSQPG